MNKGIIVVLIAILVGGGLYYFSGSALPNLGSSGPTNAGTSSVVIKSAQLRTGGVLALDVENNGASSTSTIEVADECSPDFSFCTPLNESPQTFVLPSGNEYVENFTLGQCGFAPNFDPCWGAPIPGIDYYFKVHFTLASGDSASLQVAAPAVGTFALMNSASSLNNPDRISITELSSEGVELYGNLTGTLSVVFTVDRASPPTITANLMDISSFVDGMPGSSPLVSATQSGYACGLQCQVIVEQPTQVVLSSKFSTVSTGVTAGRYYFLSISLGNYGSYFLWVQAGSTTTETATHATGTWTGYIQSVNFQAKYFNSSTTATTFTCGALGSGSESGVAVNIVNQGEVSVTVKNVTISTSGGTITLTPQGACTALGVSGLELHFRGFPHFSVYPFTGQAFVCTVAFTNGWEGTLQYKFS
jgi:hypothetical protein